MTTKEGKMDSTCVTNPNFNSMLLKHSCILITDHLGIITFASELFCKLSQYECYELIGKKESILYTSGYLKDLYDEQFTTLSIGGTWTGDLKLKAKNYTTLWMRATVTHYFDPINRQKVKVLFLQDISNEKAYQRVIGEGNHVFMEGPSIFFQFNYRGGDSWEVEFISDNITQLGFTKEQFLNSELKYNEIIFPEDCERVTKEAKDYMVSGVSSYEREYRIVSADGLIRWVHEFTKVHRDKDRAITHISGYVIDVSDQVNVKKSLKDMLKKYSDIKYALERSSILSITDRFNSI